MHNHTHLAEVRHLPLRHLGEHAAQCLLVLGQLGVPVGSSLQARAELAPRKLILGVSSIDIALGMRSKISPRGS